MCVACGYSWLCVRWNRGHWPLQISLSCFNATPNNKRPFALHPQTSPTLWRSTSSPLCFHFLSRFNFPSGCTMSPCCFCTDCMVGETCQTVQANKPKIGSKTGKVKVKYAYGVSQPTEQRWRLRIIIECVFVNENSLPDSKSFQSFKCKSSSASETFFLFIDQAVCFLTVTLAAACRALQPCAVRYSTRAFWVSVQLPACNISNH